MCGDCIYMLIELRYSHWDDFLVYTYLTFTEFDPLRQTG